MDRANQVQILAKVICISHHANTFEKGMNPFNFSRAIGK